MAQKLMTMPQAFSDQHVISGRLWCRPADARGFAYTVKSGRIMLVPSFRGGLSSLSFTRKEVTGPWVLVDPDTVNEECTP